MTPTPVPEDFHTITPQMVVKGVAAAIDWYTRALGAHELLRNAAPDGTSIMHAELLLGDSRFFVVDEFPDSVVVAIDARRHHGHACTSTCPTWMPSSIAPSRREPPSSCPWRISSGVIATGSCRDPFGHRWSIASRIEDLSPRKLQDRAKAWVKDQETS